MAKYIIRKQKQDGGWHPYYEVDDLNELPEEVQRCVMLLDAVDTNSTALIPGIGCSSVGGSSNAYGRGFYRNYYLCMFEYPGRKRVRTV